MNTKQENRLNMYLAVQAICNDLIAIYSVLPNFTDLFNQFITVIKNIKKFSEAQELDYKGKTATKNVLKSDLTGKTMEVIRRVVAYATVNDLYDLKEKVNYNESDLKKCADTELRTVCQVVHSETTAELASLADFGITQAMLDELQQTINDYFEEVPSPREGIISRKNATAALKEEFNKGNELLSQRLDKLIEMIKTSNPEAYHSYKNARIIVDLGKGRKNGSYSIPGITIDFESGLPLGGVNVAVVGTTKVVMTGIDGLFDIAVEGPGEYALRAEKEGYKALVEEEITLNGEPINVELELEKEAPVMEA